MNQGTPLQGFSVLVVDDEDLVREVACMIIQENGGEAFSAAAAEDALQVLRDSPEVNCVLVDYSMPGTNGYETFMAMEKVKPGLPTIMTSGLTVVPEVAELHRSGRISFLPKPFGEVDLVGAIQRVMEPADSGNGAESK
jgi:two-component system cell cycle sensor histidine kinase/response regulator CckA